MNAIYYLGRSSGPSDVDRSDHFEQDEDPAFRVGAALRRAVVDIFRDERPSTVAGFLIAHQEPTTIYDIAAVTGLSVETVESSVADLESEDLAVTILDGGLEKVARFAAFSLKNGRF